MREYQKGDVIRLRVGLPADTVQGVRAMQAGHEFEVIDCRDGWVKCLDGNGVKTLLPEHAVEFVRPVDTPPDDPPAGERVSQLGKRRGLTRVPEAA